MAMSGIHVPVIGRRYSVFCPVCTSNVLFDCRNVKVYGIQCHVCHTTIDLRDPSVPLPPGDAGVLSESSGTSGGVYYSTDVEESNGYSATTQVSMVMAGVLKEQQEGMPASMSGETVQAFTARRLQALSERFSFLHPIVHVIEYILFGTKPVARVGHLRVFRKWLPFIGTFYVPVPKTSVSYSVPLSVAILLFSALTYFIRNLEDVRVWEMYRLVCVFMVLFFGSILYTVYADPGFVCPAYLTDECCTGELTLKEIETKQRVSKWEVVNGEEVERKWCSTCEIYRPTRAAHCYLCGLCVMEHDHHCSVIGACVGCRNVGSFFVFLIITIILMLLPFVLVLTALYQSWNIFTLWQRSFGITIAILFLPLLCSTALLWISLIINFMFETTTRERLQSIYGNRRSPFSRGVMRNIWHHIFPLYPSSLFNEAFVQLCISQMKGKGHHHDKQQFQQP